MSSYTEKRKRRKRKPVFSAVYCFFTPDYLEDFEDDFDDDFDDDFFEDEDDNEK